MKILHIVPTYFPAHRQGGPIKSVHEINRGLVKSGVEVVVYTTNMDSSGILNVPLNQEINVNGVKVWYFPITFRPWEYSYNLHRSLAKNAKSFDLIHITSVFLSASTLSAYYAKKFRKPYIISPRGNFMQEPLKFSSLKKRIYINLIEKRNLAGASAIHFTIEKEKNDYLKLGLPLKKAIIIPNSVDFDNVVSAVSANNFTEKFKIPKDRRIVLFMGRLHKIKGLDTLIPAFAEVVKKEPKAVLVLAGPDENNYRKNLKSQISNLKIDDKVIFTGMLVGDDKIAAYRESDVFVLPSYSENFGMVVAEAMAAGKPVVITKGVGIAKKVEEAGAGLVVEKDAKQVAEAILKILNNSDLAKKIGENGRKLVKTEFSSGKVAEKFMEEYNKILQNYEE
ncbi:MAG: glycosyltransferase [Patescibacteria group bacterium]|nr:glycosyltransferase [Patescibacteria group bacterium]